MTELHATYRLQLGPDLTFADVRDLVPYLRDLGVSHLYLSPCFAAREGSTHGYDVVDPNTLSPALGDEEGFRALVEAAHAAGLGVAGVDLAGAADAKAAPPTATTTADVTASRTETGGLRTEDLSRAGTCLNDSTQPPRLLLSQRRCRP